MALYTDIFGRLDWLTKTVKRLCCNVDKIKESGAGSYKVYTAILNQSGSNAPVATVLQNTIHPDLAWGYNATGRYGISAGGSINLFNIDSNITTTSIQGALVNNTGLVVGGIYGEVDDTTVYKIYTWDSNSNDYGDGLLNNYTIEIRVYN